MNPFTEILNRNRHPLEPIATELPSQLKELPGIQAVLFDIYGTLLVSGSGDVGTAMEMTKGDALEAAWQACGVTSQIPAEEMVQQFYAVIQGDHKTATKRGTSYPEIVVEEIWQKVFAAAIDNNQVTVPPDFNPAVFALEFESRVNPVWPMPHMKEVLDTLQERGITLGIISNAQFFTPKIMEYFLGSSLEEIGFQPENCFFSYQHRVAKPGKDLYLAAAQTLAGAGIDMCHILYVGNDMLNDVQPAAQVGMKTALFAGDQRSLRLRKDDARMLPIQPDVTLTSLPDILACLPR
ncbi:HAD family hydrolase [Bremerella cremea]|uniref:HAD family hydrolase n=1 Tax=Bremerella cremea TaxID=1031537 RepID=A0A368KXW1_9BACT|nr:HAD family hydrolase [Bremerella cremea]RCS56178.1 HAD family hydrolase [Bremerella cremea]